MTSWLILNVDDRKAVRDVRSWALRRAGFQVIDVSRLEDAPKSIEKETPTLVLCGADRPETSAIAKERFPEALVVRIGGSDGEEPAAEPDRLADIYFAEGIGPDKFVASIRSLLRLKMHEIELETARARLDFLHELTSRQRDRTTITDVAEISAELLGRRLGAYRAGMYRVASSDYVEFICCWTSGYLPVFGSTESMKTLGEKLIATYRAAKTVVVENIATVTSPRPHAYASIGAPVLRHGDWVATMFVHGAEGRRWTAEEIALVEEVAGLTWDAVERVHGERWRPASVPPATLGKAHPG